MILPLEETSFELPNSEAQRRHSEVLVSVRVKSRGNDSGHWVPILLASHQTGGPVGHDGLSGPAVAIIDVLFPLDG